MSLIKSFAKKFYSAKVKGRFIRLLFAEAEAVVVEVEAEAETVEGLAVSTSLAKTPFVTWTADRKY